MNAEIALGIFLSQIFFSMKSNDFLNTHVEDAPPLEQIANVALTPYQYVFNGTRVHIEGDQVEFSPTFITEHPDHRGEMLKYGAAMIAAAPSAVLGGALKGLSYCLSSKTRKACDLIAAAHRTAKTITPNHAYFSSCGIETLFSDELISSENVPKPPSLTLRQQIETDAMHEIMGILDNAEIPCWVDGGTCLGAYRHGGMIPWDFDVDISIIDRDFDNAYEALKQLDPHKFQIQDWSGRDCPKTLLKIYVRESNSAIDIYTYHIDVEKQQVAYNFSLENSPYLPQKWKVREQPFKTPVPIDVLFPLKKGMFEGKEVRVPGNIIAWLKSKYGKNLSPARVWNEELQDYEKILDHPYWKQSHI